MNYTDEQIETAARAAHEVNRVYCRQVMDDDSHLPWKDTPEDIRRSAFSGVQGIADAPTLLPADSHEAWLDYKRAEGWVYDEVKSFADKTHPCMVPYDQLPPGQRFKDAIFGIVVRASLGIDHHVAIDVPTVPKAGQLGQS